MSHREKSFEEKVFDACSTPPSKSRKKKTSEPVVEAKYTLITNINFVDGDGLRLWANAILISEDPTGVLGPNYTMRGFSTEASAPVFTKWLDPTKQFPFSFYAAHDLSKILLSHDGTAKPIFGGSVLKFADGLEYFLQVNDESQPLDVQEFKGRFDANLIWATLAAKVAKYWFDGTYMPHQTWGPPPRTRLDAALEKAGSAGKKSFT